MSFRFYFILVVVNLYKIIVAYLSYVCSKS